MTVAAVISLPVVAAAWIALMRATRPAAPRTRLVIQRPYDWATEQEETDT